ncbi:MBL fold metallo-hydrolase [Streptomyces sp. MS2.AVA.5]|uniref:MBL fold metallo-hydrolase n=1 Tax=Streptomyces achmelvichensis TaxID=3134111 RepID=A0ACC6Q922_9ACTN
MANCVLVFSDNDALLVDTPYTAKLTAALSDAAHRLLPDGVEISTVVNTHANGDHSYGNAFFPRAEIISTEANLTHLCSEPTPAELHAMLAEADPTRPFDRYMLAHFGRYDFQGLELTPPTSTFSNRSELRVGCLDVELVEVGPAHTAGDLIVHLPASGVVCAGDVLFIDDVPVHWAGPLAGVIDACQTILDLRPRVIVPGHGPPVGPQRVRNYISYVGDIRDRIHTLHEEGFRSRTPAVHCCAEMITRISGCPSGSPSSPPRSTATSTTTPLRSISSRSSPRPCALPRRPCPTRYLRARA